MGGYRGGSDDGLASQVETQLPGSWEAPSLGRPIITLPPFLIQKLKELAIRAEKTASVSRWLGFPPYNNEWGKN